MIKSNYLSLLLLLSLIHYHHVATFSDDPFVGVNIGTDVSNLLPAPDLVNFLMHQKITHIRLYDPNPDILRALSGTHIHVTISVPNNQLLAIASSNTTATSWIRRNVAAVSLGDEVLSSLPSAAPLLLPALRSLHAALVYSNYHNDVFVSTPHSASVILNPFPPSQAFFNQTLETFIRPLIHFLSQTNSPLMLNLYPYYVFMQNRNLVPLENTLFKWCHIIVTNGITCISAQQQ